MAATPINKCRLLIDGQGTLCCDVHLRDCPHENIDAVLTSLQFGSAIPSPAVPLPPGFPAAPAEACATIVVLGHEIEIVLRDIDEERLMARMGGLIRAWCEGDEEHYGGEEDGEDDMN